MTSSETSDGGVAPSTVVLSGAADKIENANSMQSLSYQAIRPTFAG